MLGTAEPELLPVLKRNAGPTLLTAKAATARAEQHLTNTEADYDIVVF